MKKLPSHILFVSHDANRAGAQLFLLNVIKYLHAKGVRMSLLLLDGGVLEDEFSTYCSVFKFAHPTPSLKSKLLRKNTSPIFDAISAIKKQGYIDLIYVNTIACASVVKRLKSNFNCPLVTHLHELAYSIQLYSSKEHQHELFNYSDNFIACSYAVGQNIIQRHQVTPERVTTIHSFVDNQSVIKRIATSSTQQIKEKYELPSDTFLVGSCGNAEWRKGIDIFVQTAYQLKQRFPLLKFCFVWVGVKKEGELFEQLRFDIERMELQETIRIIEPTPEAIEIIHACDVFYLSSREDPFPLVMLEAALAKKAIIGYEKTGGCSEFVETDAGIVVEYLNIPLVVNQLATWINAPHELTAFGEVAYNKVTQRYNFENSMNKIENFISQLKTNP